MFHSSGDDRRQNKRYLVRGQALLRTAADAPGDKIDEMDEIINVSAGGLLVLSNRPPRVGTELQIAFTVEGYNTEVQATGRVVRAELGLAGISFVEEPEAIVGLISWLEARLLGGFL